MLLDEFHTQLLTKVLDLFPSLTEDDLKPYLLRSRATSAYDAVTLLAWSVGVAFEQAGRGKCNNISTIQTAFEKVFMVNRQAKQHFACECTQAHWGGSTRCASAAMCMFEYSLPLSLILLSMFYY